MELKKKPNRIETLTDLEGYYWLKTELIHACKSHSLSTQGLKQELVTRLKFFFDTGQKTSTIKTIQKNRRDSDVELKVTTLVKHYRNDALTRDFFIRHIGKSFRFNAYLRQFRDKNNITTGLTYGDLIQGCLKNKRNNTQKKVIPQQFEYNQFIHDFFLHEHNPTMKKAVKGWREVTSISGPNTYCFLKKLEEKN